MVSTPHISHYLIPFRDVLKSNLRLTLRLFDSFNEANRLIYKDRDI